METRIDEVNTAGDRARLGQRYFDKFIYFLLWLAIAFLVCIILYVKGYFSSDAISSNSTSGNIQVCPPSAIEVRLYQIPPRLTDTWVKEL